MESNNSDVELDVEQPYLRVIYTVIYLEGFAKYLRGVKMHPAEVHFCALGGAPARTIPKPARRP